MAKLEIIGGVLFFNLDADVGRLSPNKIDRRANEISFATGCDAIKYSLQ